MTQANGQDRYADIVASPNGTVWISDPGRDDLIEIPKTGAQQRIPVGPGANVLYAAPDGTVWLAENGAVAHVSAAGQVTQVAIPGGSGTANGLATGSDGDVWLTESAAAKIAKIDPSTNQVSEYADGVSHAAGGIAAGPDGRLWYSLPNDDELGAITTAGAVSTYQDASLGPIVNDRGSLRVLFMDGDYVFTDGAAPLGVEAVAPSSGTTSGGTRFGVIGGGSQEGSNARHSVDLVSGPDGSVYTVGEGGLAASGSEIAAISSTGGESRYGRSNGIVRRESGRLAVAPDNSIWLIAQGARSNPDIVEHLDPNAPEPCVVPPVTNLSPGKAASVLKAAHCGEVASKVTGPTDTPALVTAQKSKANSVLSPGTKVKLTVGRGVLVPCGRVTGEENRVLRVTCAQAAKVGKAIWNTAHKHGTARYHAFSCRYLKNTNDMANVPYADRDGYVDCRAWESKHRLREAEVFGSPN
ncbi:MAG: hypothetical protein J2O48_00955 [Solirubrobacterales bacterium]|nr:hypothetical protein [Solirubrobacterales bacterium]